MPKYYCDYCDIFLTHDAPRVRRDHNAGWKHGAQVRAHFLSMNLERMARNVGEVIKDYEDRNELVPVPAPISAKQKPKMPPPGIGGMNFAPGMNLPPGMNGLSSYPPGMSFPPNFPVGNFPTQGSQINASSMMYPSFNNINKE